MLRFTPYAWAKLHYFCHCGETEIGGFGVTAADDLLLIEDFVTVKQSVSLVTVAFDDESVADFFEDQVDRGLQPVQFGRIWLHTHPGNCANPSGTDEATFTRVFGGCDWAVMFILAKGGETYARLRFNVGPGGQSEIPVAVDYSRTFACSDHAAWQKEYATHIHIDQPRFITAQPDPLDESESLDQWLDPFDHEFEDMFGADPSDFDPSNFDPSDFDHHLENESEMHP